MAIVLAPLALLASQAALALGKGALTKAAMRSLITGAAFQTGAEIVAQIAEWARSVGGEFDTTGASDTGKVDGCRESASAGQLEFWNGNNWLYAGQGGSQAITAQTVEILETDVLDRAEGVADATARIRTTNYGEVVIEEGNGSPEMAALIRWRIKTDDCLEFGPGPGPGPDDGPGPIILPPLQSGDCTIKATFHGFLANPDGTGNVQPVFVMEPGDARANGGVIVGDCNFAPTVVIGGGGDGNEPPDTYPLPPDPPGSDGWWEAIAKGAAAGLAAAVVGAALEAIFGGQAAANYTLVAPCDKDEEGNPLTYTASFPEQSYATRMLAWQVASADLLQQHLNWKTPICSDEKPVPEGDWRTISFRSETTSPYGKSCLRKRFRYRSTSGLGLGELIDYWKDFTVESGPYRVRHTGANWGNLEVWAATEDEGKRVIRHAGGEAGIDPDQVGRWSTRRSDSARLGVPASMKVDTTGGYYWITARDGSDNRPVVALTSDQ